MPTTPSTRIGETAPLLITLSPNGHGGRYARGEKPVFHGYKDTKHAQQGAALTAALGRSVIAFERVCAGMRICVYEIFRREGLNQTIAQAAVANQTAGQLRRKLEDLYHELSGQNNEDRRCVSQLLTDIKDLTDKRNALLHSEWLLGDEPGAEELTAVLLKPDVDEDKNGVITVREENVTQIEDFIQEATRIQVLLQRLQVCITQRGFNVSAEFSRPLY